MYEAERGGKRNKRIDERVAGTNLSTVSRPARVKATKLIRRSSLCNVVCG